MNLLELINDLELRKVKIEIEAEVLFDFAKLIAETTAKRITEELNVPEKPVTEKYICALLSKTRQTISSYRKQGKLRYHRIGREIYYYLSEVNEDLKKF